MGQYDPQVNSHDKINILTMMTLMLLGMILMLVVMMMLLGMMTLVVMRMLRHLPVSLRMLMVIMLMR